MNNNGKNYFSDRQYNILEQTAGELYAARVEQT